MTFLQSKKKKKKIEDLIDDTIKDRDPFSTLMISGGKKNCLAKKILNQL